MWWRYFIVCCVSALAQVAAARVVITEVMFNPVGSDSHDEFVELQNLSGDQLYDLNGWQISDGSSKDTILNVEQGTTLLPGQVAVILDPSYFDNSTTYDSLIPPGCLILTIDNTTFGSRGLSNSTAELVSLSDRADNVVDSYRYSLDNKPGYSDEKIEVSGDSSAVNWQNSLTFLGSPGSRNSVSPKEFDLSIAMTRVDQYSEDMLNVVFRIQNSGNLFVTEFEVHFVEELADGRITEIAPALHFSGNLTPGDSMEFRSAPFMLSPGLHTINVIVAFPADQDRSNNVGSLQYAGDFEVGVLGINEIMHRPGSDGPEWIEFINNGPDVVDLFGWSVMDADSDMVTCEQHVLLASQGFVIVSAKPVSFSHAPPFLNLILPGFPILNNDGDSILLLQPANSCVDRVDYDDSWDSAHGVSMERIDPMRGSSNARNWGLSAAPAGATPGYSNSLFADEIPSAIILQANPGTFSPDGDGYDDLLEIQFQLPFPQSRVNLKILDLRGRMVNFLMNNRHAGVHNRITWDGKGQGGEQLPVGIYIVFVETISAQAGRIESARQAVILARRL